MHRTSFVKIRGNAATNTCLNSEKTKQTQTQKKTAHKDKLHWPLLLVLMLTIQAVFVLNLRAQGQTIEEGLGVSLELEALTAIDRGSAYLIDNQLPNGSWRNHPAITSLAALALANLPDNTETQVGNTVELALEYLKDQIHNNGAMWNEKTEQYKLYSTAIGVLALVRCNRPQDLEAIGKVRNFLISTQRNNKLDNDPFSGGFARSSREFPTLTVTQWVGESLYLIDSLRLPRNLLSSSYRLPQISPVYSRAIEFIKRCQIYSENKNAPKIKSADNGRFRDLPISVPENQHLDRTPGTPRSPVFLTCLGIKTLRYAGYKTHTPRIQKALDYLCSNWSVTNNPSLGMKGYYTYLYALTKTLKSLDIPSINNRDRNFYRWRQEIVSELLSRQRGNGSWRQTHAAWWENNSSLVTAYALLIIERCLTY